MLFACDYFSGRMVHLKLDQTQLLITGSREDVKLALDFFRLSFLSKLGYDKLEISETGLRQSDMHSRSLELCGRVV